MHPKEFFPYRGGAIDWTFTHPDEVPVRHVKIIFEGAWDEVIEPLHRSYFNAVETYNLSHRVSSWIDRTPLDAFMEEAGKIYVTLDYFLASLPLPREVQELGQSKESVFQWYFYRRGLENIQTNSAGLLRALAISGLIPDAWFPENDLENLVVKTIRRSGLFADVEVDCQLRLEPGGLRWLSSATMQTVAKIRARLADEQPCLVRLVRNPGRLSGNLQAIVYACHEQPGGSLRLDIFEPDFALPEHALLVKSSGDTIEVIEMMGQDRRRPLHGLLWEAYSPVPPPQECSSWLLRWKAFRWIWKQEQAIEWLLSKRAG